MEDGHFPTPPRQRKTARDRSRATEPRREFAMWKPSRFNIPSRTAEGALLVYNSLSGALLQFDTGVADYVANLLSHPSAVELDDNLRNLASQGILVPDSADELARASQLHKASFDRNDQLQLILMPTEACNFRCVYCYETFARGIMPTAVTESIIRLIRSQSNQLNSLHVGWFGGEPLLAIKVIEKISTEAIQACRDGAIVYSSSITTNGSMLSRDVAERCFVCKISHFQITLDGPDEEHNKLRVRANGSGTYAQVFKNLCDMRSLENDFRVVIRVNYTAESAASIPAFIDTLASHFASDGRFSLQFHPVGRWGGPNDDQLMICDQKNADSRELHFMSLASRAGFELNACREGIRPFGSVCYAANPRSFVIGSDGTVYKCTVAFDDPRNQIGQLMPDGTLAISEALHSLWTSSGEELDSGCQACALRPACQGNACPLERLNTGKKPCPPFKRKSNDFLRVFAGEEFAVDRPEDAGCSCETAGRGHW
jgi:uncharacterized protein